MKKNVSLVLAVLLMLSLCACGSTSATESTSATNPSDVPKISVEPIPEVQNSDSNIVPVAAEYPNGTVLQEGEYIVGVDIEAGDYNITVEGNISSIGSLTITPVSTGNTISTPQFQTFSSSGSYFHTSLVDGDKITVFGVSLRFTQGTEQEYREWQWSQEANRQLSDEEKTIAIILKGIPQVVNVAVASEENDPWGSLHKSGGYQALVFFTLNDTNPDLQGEEIVAARNDAGGCVELYEDAALANNRNDYLKGFDGNVGMLNPGSHTVFGSMVIRTSSTLTATRQREVEQAIIEAFQSYEKGTLQVDVSSYLDIIKPASISAAEPISTSAPATTSNPVNTPEQVPAQTSLSNESFDYEALLSSKEGFSYDKFDKKWKWSMACSKIWTDAKMFIGIQAISTEGGEQLNETSLYIKCVDNNGNVIKHAQAVDFSIDGTTYSYKKMLVSDESGMVALGENGNLLIEALAFCDASTVSVRVKMEDNTYTFDLDPSNLTWTLKDYCRSYLELNLWSYCSNREQMAKWEEQYPLTVDGQPADYTTMRQNRDLSRIDETFVAPKVTSAPTTPASTPVPTYKPSATPAPKPSNGQPEYEITDLIYEHKSDYVNGEYDVTIIEVTNTGTVPIYLEDCVLDFEDNNGHLLHTDDYVSNVPDIVQPGEKGYFYTTSYFDDGVSFANGCNLVPTLTIKKAKGTLSRHQVIDTSLFMSTSQYVGVKGRIVNESNKEISYMYVTVVYYDKDGRVLGINGTSVTNIPANAKKSFEISGFIACRDFTLNDVGNYVVYADEMYMQF